MLMLVAGIVLYSVCNIGFAQYKKSEVSAPPTIFTGKSNVPDSTGMHYPVKATITPGYDELTSPDRQAIDFKDPSNIKTEVEYDYTTDTYVVRTRWETVRWQLLSSCRRRLTTIWKCAIQ